MLPLPAWHGFVAQFIDAKQTQSIEFSAGNESC